MLSPIGVIGGLFQLLSQDHSVIDLTVSGAAQRALCDCFKQVSGAVRELSVIDLSVSGAATRPLCDWR
jgi:hypothetical protein